MLRAGLLCAVGALGVAALIAYTSHDSPGAALATPTTSPVEGPASSLPPEASRGTAPGPTSTPGAAPVTEPISPGSGTALTPSTGALLVDVVGVTDGDTIRVRVGSQTERLRVIGIDTPELRARDCFAQQASSRMQSLVQSKQVRIQADSTQDDRDRYGRLLRHVFLTDGRSVGELLIAEGFAREYTYDVPYLGQAGYRAAERSAQAARAGLWGACGASSGGSGSTGPAATPAPLAGLNPPAPSASAAAGCQIKGNISRSGEKIYHVPGQRHYDKTVIDQSAGERWFCSEDDAVAAGWRRSRQ